MDNNTYCRWTKEDEELLKITYSQYPVNLPNELTERISKKKCIEKAKRMKIRQFRFHGELCNQQIVRDDIAYIAGFLDADGTIYFNNQNQKYYVAFANCDLAVLEWIRSVIGCGNIDKKSHYPSYTVSHYALRIVRMADTLCLLKQLTPYLHVKKQIAIKAIEYTEIKLSLRDKYVQ